MHRKARAGDAVGKGRWSGGRPLQNQITFWSSHPSRRHFLAQFRQTSPARFLFHDALWLDVFIQGVIGVQIKVIVIHFRLKSSVFFEVDVLLTTGRIMQKIGFRIFFTAEFAKSLNSHTNKRSQSV